MIDSADFPVTFYVAVMDCIKEGGTCGIEPELHVRKVNREFAEDFILLCQAFEVLRDNLEHGAEPRDAHPMEEVLGEDLCFTFGEVMYSFSSQDSGDECQLSEEALGLIPSYFQEQANILVGQLNGLCDAHDTTPFDLMVELIVAWFD